MSEDKKNEIAKRRADALATAGNLDELINVGTQALIASAAGGIAETLALAMAVVDIKAALTPAIMRPIMSLQGSAIGFKTDQVYSEDVVKEAVVESLIKGVPVAGNCMNIISKRAYTTKEGFSFLIKKLQEQGKIGTFKFILGIPRVVDGRTVVDGKAEWTQNGKTEIYECELPIKTNGGSTDDNTLGKAERKLKARCYERMTGIMIEEGDVSDGKELRTASGITVQRNMFQRDENESSERVTPEETEFESAE